MSSANILILLPLRINILRSRRQVSISDETSFILLPYGIEAADVWSKLKPDEIFNSTYFLRVLQFCRRVQERYRCVSLTTIRNCRILHFPFIPTFEHLK